MQTIRSPDRSRRRTSTRRRKQYNTLHTVSEEDVEEEGEFGGDINDAHAKSDPNEPTTGEGTSSLPAQPEEETQAGGADSSPEETKQNDDVVQNQFAKDGSKKGIAEMEDEVSEGTTGSQEIQDLMSDTVAQEDSSTGEAKATNDM